MSDEHTLRRALDTVLAKAWGKPKPYEDMPFASIPARPGVDAELIVADAIDELIALRAEVPRLREALAQAADDLWRAASAFRKDSEPRHEFRRCAAEARNALVEGRDDG